MKEIDRAMIEDYQVELVMMMENAGKNLAALARERFLKGNPKNKKTTILIGTGGNGGGALVCARHLYNWGAKLEVILTKKIAEYKNITAQQLNIIQMMEIKIHEAGDTQNLNSPGLIIDGIIGYSLSGKPSGTAAGLIKWANNQNSPILALDVPSGIEVENSVAYEPSIKATATLTLALPKSALYQANIRRQVGELYLADISVPPALYAKPPLQINIGQIFAKNEIIRLF